jgi:hypothetical protein
MADTKLPEGTDSIIEGAGSGGTSGGMGRSGTTNQGGSTSSMTNSTGARTATTDSASGTDALLTAGGTGAGGTSLGGAGTRGTTAGGIGTSGAGMGGAGAGGIGTSGGTGVTGQTGDASGGEQKSGVRGMISNAGTKVKGEAATKAREYVGQGLERGSTTLTNVATLIEDAVQQIEEKLGPQVGGYARTASQTINGYATSLQNKDPDELVDDARELIRKSPGIALAGAAVVGFGLVRLVKAGIEEAQNGTGTRQGNRAS